MPKRILIEQAQNGYAVRCGADQTLAAEPLQLVATWGELIELIDSYLAEGTTGSFGKRDSFPLIEALRSPQSALERLRSEAPTVKVPVTPQSSGS